MDTTMSNLELLETHLFNLEKEIETFENDVYKNSQYKLKEFMIDYITREELILKIFEDLGTERVSKDSEIKEYVQKFKTFQTEYKDKWDTNYWKEYNNSKKMNKSNDISYNTSFCNESNLCDIYKAKDINNNYDNLSNKCDSDSNNDIKNMDADYSVIINKKEEKDRSCLNRCFIF